MRLDAYTLTADSIVALSPAPSRRAWMDRTPERFANRCLPLMMANQAGWQVTLTEPVDVEWSGRDGHGEVSVYGPPLVQQNVASHFGSGIVTFKLPFLFRTEPGYNLLARGPANQPKDGLSPLEGLIETDWSFAPFTMNWQITRPRVRLRFDAGEPIALLVPARRGELEAFTPRLLALDDDAEVSVAYRAWRRSRETFLTDLAAGAREAVETGWQRDYFRGRGPGDQEVPEHQTKMTLRGFRGDPS
jgi:antitoxin (DNA-binding transcriptional repressor) of toxin-antitoxin stability system